MSSIDPAAGSVSAPLAGRALASTSRRSPEAERRARLRGELLDFMTRSGISVSWLSLIVALVTGFILHDHAEALPLALWFAAMIIVSVMRVCFYLEWRRCSSNPDINHAVWERRYAFIALAAGMAWAALAAFVHVDDPALNYVIAMVITTAAFSGLITHGLNRMAYPLFMLPIFLAQSLALATSSLPYATAMLFVWVLLGALNVFMYRIVITGFGRNLKARIAQEAFAAEQRTLLDTLTVGVLVTNRRTIQDCNETFLRMFGYTRAEIIGQSTRILMTSDREFADAGNRNRDLLEGRPIIKQTRRRRRDGSMIEVEINLGLVEPGNPESPIVGTYEDITEQLRIESDLRVSRERLRMALDALQSGVWDIDLQAARFFFSRRFKSILGLTDEHRLDELDHRVFFHHSMVHEDDRARIADARMDTLLNGAAFDAQYRIEIEGRLLWLRETVLALVDENGKPYRFTGSITDTTTVNEIQERLRASEVFHRGMIETTNSLIWRSDPQGRLTFVNENGARDLYGYEASEMIGRHIYAFFAPESMHPDMIARFDPVTRGEAVRNVEVVQYNKRQRRIFVSINAVPLFDARGQYDGAMGINTDITHLKKRERAFQDATRLQRLIVDSAGEGIVLMRNGRVYRANQAFADLVGTTVGDLVARPLDTWFENPAAWHRVESQLAELGNVIKVEQRLMRKDAEPLWVSVTGRRAEMEDRHSVTIWVFADISARKESEERSWHRANHDDLTGLPNRRLLQDRIEQALVRARRESERMGILMLDLDGFKDINDAHGHQVGDLVLREIAQRLSHQVRQLDTVARLGGDEFVVILNHVASLNDVEVLANRLVDRIHEPVLVNGHALRISTSIGVALFPEHADGIPGLMHAADMAMYAAKASGKNTYRVALPVLRSQRGGVVDIPR